ncbi:ribonuclease P [Methanocella sp. CWC-04]|uniref:Ribonuclease P protein component 1 n=1 Tax=Methanooceanicella nereidis TaxID=2052831 RepID=A0AAP2W3U2_9EURY|nr:ribonuclease P protein component 1 [Methanocella sp. CWC-04]MCD1293505.1 ribonuclease P [Methanocella sp. CWC-04]
MDITPENIVYHELIGLEVEVVSPAYPDLKGTVIDESRNMLVLKTEKHDKKVPKSCCSFIFTLPDGRRVKVLGTLLLSQPENRIPKKKRR